MSNQKLSVSGLANIGKLLNRGELPKPVPVQKDVRKSQDTIIEKTVNKLLAKVPSNMRDAWRAEIIILVTAAVREAYNLGHADSLTQSAAVETLLDKQYRARTELTMPAVVAAVMEQLGMTTMTVDLEALATVFDRVRIDMIPMMGAAGEFVEYRLVHKSDEINGVLV